MTIGNESLVLGRRNLVQSYGAKNGKLRTLNERDVGKLRYFMPIRHDLTCKTGKGVKVLVELNQE
jgi:hypothetical protein